MKRSLVLTFLTVLLIAGCGSPKSDSPGPAQLRTEAEFHTWAVERYKKADGHDPDANQLKLADKFAKQAAEMEKSQGKRLDDDQLVAILADLAADAAFNPNNH